MGLPGILHVGAANDEPFVGLTFPGIIYVGLSKGCHSQLVGGMQVQTALPNGTGGNMLAGKIPGINLIFAIYPVFLCLGFARLYG
jgi:hypothetical protein